MATNKKSGSWVKRVLIIVLLVGVAVAAYIYFRPNDSQVVSEEINIELEEEFEQQEVSAVERLTKAELEESINSTTDGMVPENIINRFSPNVQKVVVKNDPDANITAGISEVWLSKTLGLYSKVVVVEEECVFDSNNRLETLVIIAE